MTKKAAIGPKLEHFHPLPPLLSLRVNGREVEEEMDKNITSDDEGPKMQRARARPLTPYSSLEALEAE